MMQTPIPSLEAIPDKTPKSPAAKNKLSQKAPIVALREVLSAIGEHEPTRRRVLDRFKAHGGSLNVWQRSDRRCMADAITSAEDALEMQSGSLALRLQLRAIRRRLENEAFA